MALLGNRMPDYPPSGRNGFKRLRAGNILPSRIAHMVSEAQEELVHTIGVCISEGAGFMLSPTSDGGALAVIVYVGSERHRDYASDTETFRALLLAVEDVAQSQMARPAPKAQ